MTLRQLVKIWFELRVDEAEFAETHRELALRMKVWREMKEMGW